MTPGSVVFEWLDAVRNREPSKQRPAVVVGRADLFHADFAYLFVAPLTGDGALRVTEASLEIAPTKENGCSKRCYALSWNAQVVPKRRIRPTKAHVTTAQLQTMRDQIARLVER